METRRANSNALSRFDVEGKIVKNYWACLRWVVEIFIVILVIYKNHTCEKRAERFSTRRSPLVGHAAGGFPASVASGSCSISMYPWMRSRLHEMILKTLYITDYEAHLLACTSNSLKVLTHHKIIVQNSTTIFKENPVLPAPTEGP